MTAQEMTEELSEGGRQVVGGGEVERLGAFVAKVNDRVSSGWARLLEERVGGSVAPRERVNRNVKSGWFGGCEAEAARGSSWGGNLVEWVRARGGRQGREVATQKGKLGLQGRKTRR
jgi:hypothetical protein